MWPRNLGHAGGGGGEPRVLVAPLFAVVTWWLTEPLADLQWSVVRTFPRAFPVVDGQIRMAVQACGNRIEILSKLTNQTIILLSHIVSIGQMNWVCQVVVSLFH